MDLDSVLRNLSQKREMFHSEADFQFAIAEEIKNKYPKSNVRLEKLHIPVKLSRSFLTKLSSLFHLQKNLQRA